MGATIKVKFEYYIIAIEIRREVVPAATWDKSGQCWWMTEDDAERLAVALETYPETAHPKQVKIHRYPIARIAGQVRESIARAATASVLNLRPEEEAEKEAWIGTPRAAIYR